MARDVFSLIHFPMLWGVIGYAVVLEAAIDHPTGPQPFGVRLALALGFLLFVGGMVAATWRACHRLLLPRLIVTLVCGAIVLALDGANAVLLLAVAVGGLLAIALLEQRRT